MQKLEKRSAKFSRVHRRGNAGRSASAGDSRGPFGLFKAEKNLCLLVLKGLWELQEGGGGWRRILHTPSAVVLSSRKPTFPPRLGLFSFSFGVPRW